MTHYVFPDVGVLVDYQEVLEFRELRGVVFTQTACHAVQHSKGRRYKLDNLLINADRQHVTKATHYLVYYVLIVLFWSNLEHP